MHACDRSYKSQRKTFPCTFNAVTGCKMNFSRNRKALKNLLGCEKVCRALIEICTFWAGYQTSLDFPNDLKVPSTRSVATLVVTYTCTRKKLAARHARQQQKQFSRCFAKCSWARNAGRRRRALSFHMRALSEICRASHTAAARRATCRWFVVLQSHIARCEWVCGSGRGPDIEKVNQFKETLTVRRASSRDFAAADDAAAGTVVFYVTRL